MINLTEKEIIENWNFVDEAPLVTIKCLAYNHEKYIARCLDGLLKQKTNFRFRILIHDDCSCDNTINILKTYHKKFPNIVVPLYEKENQFSKIGLPFVYTIDKYIDSKYIALCECDDYWIDETKLQKQVDFMQNHEDCSLILTNGYQGYGINEKNKKVINPYDVKNSCFITLKDICISQRGLVPTCSMLFNTSVYKQMPDFFKNAPVGDITVRMWCALNGSVYYMVDPLVFFTLSSGESSFSNIMRNDSKAAYLAFDGFKLFLNNFDSYTNFQFHDLVDYMLKKEEFKYYERTGNSKMMICCDYWNSPFVENRNKKKAKLLIKLKFKNLYSLYRKLENKG